ncbi:hypothetical protein [Chromatium okenii]|jgi:hypothetical protein|uniref:hypothetical protein n=1 Tax=Chromatium okenii TaxID=61644 RepID=UPI0026F0DA7E|nr:hypothetical protein [Chromatium okenii]MBV5309617.1 hypothetical protein [Chromatium okenii]
MYKPIDVTKALTVATLATGILWTGLSPAAALQNGDFSSGFTGWAGQAGSDDVDLPSTNFDASSGAATLTTNYGDGSSGGAYALHLFQTFDLQALSPAIAGLQLSFTASWSADDATGGDIWIAQLIDMSDASHFLDLTTGVSSFDVTGFSGRSVQLQFGLENIAGADDKLTIDSIAITARQGAVPVPGTLVLLSIGLVALRRQVF